MDLDRRQFLGLGASALAGTTLLGPRNASAQTPKRGGVFRLCTIIDPVGLDPHQTISFATMLNLSFTHSRLVKVKAGPSVKPGTYPIEADLAESWTRPNATTYGFKLRSGWRAATQPLPPS